jgi:hypothetical protein
MLGQGYDTAGREQISYFLGRRRDDFERETENATTKGAADPNDMGRHNQG